MTHAQSSIGTPVPDPEAISKFVEVAFGYCDGFVPVRCLAETGTVDKKPHSEFHRIETLADALIRLAPRAARDQRGLYVVPGTVAKPGSARARDIIQTAVLLVDLDKGDIAEARAHLERNIGPATLAVASGGRTASGEDKLHLYWRLTEATVDDDLERVRALREMVAAKVGGDDAFDSLHQPIRVPGSVHGKQGVCSPVRIVTESLREYELQDLEGAVHDMPSLQDGPSPSSTYVIAAAGPSATSLATTTVREGNQDEISRYDALSKVIGHWLRNHRLGHCSIEDAWEAVRDHNAAMIAPPWDEARLHREFEALRKLDQKNHGPIRHQGERANADETVAITALSDDAIAATFVSEAAGRFRYVPAWGKWMRWSDGRWTEDETGAARELSRQVCRGVGLKAQKPPEARRIASDKTIAAVLRISNSDPQLATGSAEWDAHPFLLNTPGGIIDLETGEVRAHDARLKLTQMAGASMGSGCPRWRSFLHEVTAGDTDLQSYLARLAGYCLTGSTSEQMFAFFHGNGANGKSVFINTIAAVMSDYVATAANETFMASRSERHLTELAGLRAARLVVVPETEHGRSWAEARIKSVTGGEKIRANFMRQDHFEFVPQFKLIVAGNHRPSLTGVGEAMRRRLHLVPFDVTIPPDQRDPNLGARLLEERDGILGWMLDGCAEWQRIGLSPPESVVRAVTRYFEDEDLVGQWIEDSCDVGDVFSAMSKRLFDSWSTWAKEAGHPEGSQKSLGTALRERGFVAGKVEGHRGWLGIAPRVGQHREGSA